MFKLSERITRVRFVENMVATTASVYEHNSAINRWLGYALIDRDAQNIRYLMGNLLISKEYLARY